MSMQIRSIALIRHTLAGTFMAMVMATGAALAADPAARQTATVDAEGVHLSDLFAGIDAATERVIVDLFHDIRANGATVLCVHHDLQTVRDYFDHALVLNMRAIASGPVNVVINEENLQSAYGGRLAANEIRAITKAG